MTVRSCGLRLAQDYEQQAYEIDVRKANPKSPTPSLQRRANLSGVGAGSLAHAVPRQRYPNFHALTLDLPEEGAAKRPSDRCSRKAATKSLARRFPDLLGLPMLMPDDAEIIARIAAFYPHLSVRQSQCSI